VFGVQIKLTDEQGNTITTPNQAGDVWVNSVTRCFFYWRKFEQSQSTFHGPWTRTGDQLYFDEDGFFWFAGRGDDVFKVKGLWVSPIEVEAVITAHAAVLEAARETDAVVEHALHRDLEVLPLLQLKVEHIVFVWCFFNENVTQYCVVLLG
jgi:acyl-coenzyme A synthetase/AMP-(fatty) acid ligase